MAAEPIDPVAELRRWEQSGAGWRVAARTSERVVVELLSCEALDVVGSVVGTPTELDGYLAGRRRSEDPAGP
jgi:hypothetical protein